MDSQVSLDGRRLAAYLHGQRAVRLAMLAFVLFAGIFFAGRSDAAARRLDFVVQACPEKPCAASPNPDWVWFSANPRVAAALEPNWQLLVDNVRFRDIEVRVRHKGGVFVLKRDQFGLSENWAVGNNLRFTPGRSKT